MNFDTRYVIHTLKICSVQKIKAKTIFMLIAWTTVFLMEFCRQYFAILGLD